VQLGVWLQTGYALTPTLRPWAAFTMSVPGKDQLDFALPLAVGAYTWWPCAPVLGLAGLLALARRGAVVWMLLSGAGALLAFYLFVDFARLHYWAYGPRYQLPATVPMAVGGGVWLARAFIPDSAGAAGTRRVAPLITVCLSLVLTAALVWIGVHTYPLVRDESRARSATLRAISEKGIHHAVVWVDPYEVSANPSSLTQNSAVGPAPDVVVAIRRGREVNACVRRLYPDRTFYRALGLRDVTLVEELSRP
jgi:hypothetical protein